MSTQPPVRPTAKAMSKRRAERRRRTRLLLRQLFSVFFIGIFVLGTIAFVIIPQVGSQQQATQTPLPASSSPVALTQVLPTGTAGSGSGLEQLVQKADDAAAKQEWQTAAGFYKAALGLTSGNATIEFKLGKAYGNMGDYANAVDHLQKALQLNPQASFAAEAQTLLTQYQSKASVTPGGGLLVRGTVTTTGTITATEPMTK